MALPKPIPTLTYPLGLLDSPDMDYMAITAVKYEPPGTTQRGSAFNFESGSAINSANIKNNPLENNVGFIFLPIPDNVQDTNQTNWRSSDINSLQMDGLRFGSKIVDAFTPGGGGLEGAGNAFNQLLAKYKGAITDQSIIDNLERVMLGNAVNTIGGNLDAQDLISRETGQILNPNMELLFKSIQLQNFTFSFKFTPRSAAEGEAVKAIIRTFKRRMSPKSTATTQGGAGLFISAPDVFKLQFMKGGVKHPFLPTYKICALTNIQVQYTGGGSYATYYDGTPVNVSMTLNFTELSPVYAEDYTDDIEGVGF